MKKMIIEIEGGVVSGVYTSLPEDIEILIKDSDDKHDDDRVQDYYMLQQLIDRGCIEDTLYQEMNPEEEPSISAMLNPNVFLIIKDANTAKTEEGKHMQQLNAAFIDGYLTAQAEITRFIWKMYRSKDKDNQNKAHMLSAMLKPLIQQQHDHYFKLCEFVNRSDFFDQSEGESQI